MPEVIESAAPDVSTSVDTPSLAETPEISSESSELVDSASPTTGEEQSQDSGEITDWNAQIPMQLKQLMKELQQANPDLASKFNRYTKQIVGAQHELKAVRSMFPGGVNEIKKVAQIVEAIGGEQGIAEIEAERQEWNDLDQLYTTGDPRFIDRISEEDPEAFKKLVVPAINKFSQIDPDGYSHLMAGIVVETVKGIANKLYNAMVAADPHSQLAAELADWYNSLDKLARVKPVPKVDPEREKLTKEREDWENQKAQEFHQGVTEANQKFRVSAIQSELTAQLTKAGKNVEQLRKQSPDSYRILMMNCEQTALQILAADKKWIEQYNAVLLTGDKNRASQMHNAKIQQILKGDGQNKGAVAKTLRAFYAFGSPAPTNGKPPVAVQSAPNNGAFKAGEVQLSHPPDRKNIDYDRTSPTMLLDGKAYLKGKKALHRF